MKSDIFGLDIGSSKMKAVWLSREKNSISYLNSATAPTPTPGMQSESPFDHQELAQSIHNMVSSAKILTNKVAIALPENHIYTKVIEMPFLPEKELASAIYWEAEEQIPAPIDTMSLSWTVLHGPSSSSNTQKMQVLLIAAPIQLIKRYQSVLQIAGLSVVAIESEMLSIVRSIFPTPNSPTSIVLNIGTLSTSFAIIQSGIMVFNYSIPLGGVAMTRAIASSFGLSMEQAEEYKKTYGLSDKNLSGKVGKAVNPIFSNIITELKKAIAFHNEKYKSQSPPSQIVIVGASAYLPGIDVFFVENTGLETVIANPWKSLNTLNVPSQVQQSGPEYAIACGLAIKDYE